MALRRFAALGLVIAVSCSGSNEPSVAAGTNSMQTAAQSSGKAGTSAAAAGSGAKPSGSTAAAAGAAPAKNGDMFSPLCSEVPPTAAGDAPAKGGACTASDSQLCYKTCGPQSVGFKSETCTNGAYAEQSGCTFPEGDYACYKIPTTVSASCPTTAPRATTPCEVAMCTPCNVGGNYLDSSGASKMGYCVCPMAGDSGMRNWSCASATAWPCPLGKGC